MADPFKVQDRDKISVLLSPFRESRDVNPHSWDSKMAFWTNQIKTYCSKHGLIYLDAKKLPEIFAYQGKRPQCLGKVLDQLKSEGYIQNEEDFQTSFSNSWLSWGFQTMIKKPLRWGLRQFIVQPMSWTLRVVTGQPQADVEGAGGTVIVTEVLKDRAETLVKFYCIDSPITNHYANFIDYTSLWEAQKNNFHSKTDLDVVLGYLQNQKQVTVSYENNKGKVVQFLRPGEAALPKETNQRLYKMKLTLERLNKEVEELDIEMEQNRNTAKKHLRAKEKEQAKECLKKKQRLEKLKMQKLQTIENLEGLTQAISEANTNKMVVDAFAHGSAAFQDITRTHGLNQSKVEDVMADVDESIAMSTDINEALSSRPHMGSDISMSELEEELDELLSATSTKSPVTKDELPEFPDIPQSEPGSSVKQPMPAI